MRVCALCVTALALGGCASPPHVREAFPPGGSASPWLLQGEVWSGDFAAASPALGAESAEWESFGPTHAWLAVYCHEADPTRCLKVRTFAFGTADSARAAYAAFVPPHANSYTIGDGGCWTEMGVLFHWGRLVIEIFGESASWGSQVQSSLIATYMARRMPPGAPENPQ